MEFKAGLESWAPLPGGQGHFGDPDAELEALTSGVGLQLPLGRVLWSLRGADVLSYLHRMTTQALDNLAEGEVRPSCLLTTRGRILADLLVWRSSEGVFVGTGMAAAAEALPVLEKYVIMDDVQIEDISAGTTVGRLIGPVGQALLEGMGAGAGDVNAIEVAGHPVTVLRRNLGGHPAWRILAPTAAAPEVYETFLAAGATRTGPDAYERCRVAAGVARYGSEFGPDRFFNEVDLEDHVHWSKGCYPGQEPVIMAKHRGAPPRRLVALSGEDDRRPEAGEALQQGGADVGQLTSVAAGLAPRTWYALGYVRHALALPDAAFETAGGVHLSARLTSA